MKTIYITEEQKKKIQKTIAAQDQVGGKVNAGVMDAVVGGMCENVEEDEYELAAEKNEVSPYYHIKEGKLNESPDFVYSLNLSFDKETAYPFIFLWDEPQLFIGDAHLTHKDVVREINPDLEDKFMRNPLYETCDEMMTGRYWKEYNVISFWKTPINNRIKVRKVIDKFIEQGIIKNSNYTLIDYWDNNLMSVCLMPVKWLFNGTYDIFSNRCSRIAPIKSKEYIKTGKYTWFQVYMDGKGTQCVNLNGDEILTGLQYQMRQVNESQEGLPQDTITLYHGVNSKNLEYNLEHGGFIPRVCSEGGPKAVWLSEKQYNYNFTFAFDIPKTMVTQLSNVDYIFEDEISFNDFNCRLIKTSIYIHLDNMTSVDINIFNDKLSKIHFRYFPDLGMKLWKEFKNYPNILNEYINPYIEKFQTLSEDINSDSIYEGKKKVIKNDEGEIVPEKCDKCGGKVVCQIHGEPVYVCKECGKYFGTMPFTLKENIENEISPEDVDLSSFNIKKKLNPNFWIDGHLDSRIRLKLMDISDDFIEYLGIDPNIVKDVIMTGSLANFNWNERFSDIDLHILLDYSDVDDNIDFVKQYFMSQKTTWNNEHGDISILGFPVEVYVQDINEKHDSSGIYSLDRDKWLIEPDRDVLATSKVNKEYIRNKVSDYTNKIDKLIYLYNKNKNDNYRLEKLGKKSEKLWDEIKNNRKRGFEISNGKEINNFNVIFKYLRRKGYLDKLYKLKTKAYNKLNSIE